MNKYEKFIKDIYYAFLFKFRKVKSSFFIFLSRKILKNEGGIDLFLSGTLQHFFIRKFCKNKQPPASVSDQNQGVVPFLHENKFSPVSLNIPEEILNPIREKAAKYIENDGFSYVRGGDQGNTKEMHYTRAMKNIVGNIPEVKDILTPELQSIIMEYFDSNMGVTSVLFWRNYHVPEDKKNKIVYSNEWHNDNIAPMELKLFVNMTDVTENHGPLHVINVEVSKQLVKEKAFRGRKKKNNDLAALENKNHVIKHIGKAGSAVLAHASCCLHRADIPAEGNYRDMLEFQFHPSIKPLSDDWDKKPLKYQ